MVTGGCDCGKVRFQASNLRDAITVCHCGQCRRTSGYLWASTATHPDNLVFLQDAGLTWYASSEFAKRGFCRFCGSSLFYRINDNPKIGIAVGALDAPEGLHLAKHIYTADCPDYDVIHDTLPRFDTY